jgi:hypothetical protein
MQVFIHNLLIIGYFVCNDAILLMEEYIKQISKITMLLLRLSITKIKYILGLNEG